jgi:hypothetical protein
MHPALHVCPKASVYGLDVTKVVIIFEITKFYKRKIFFGQKKLNESSNSTVSAIRIPY